MAGRSLTTAPSSASRTPISNKVLTGHQKSTGRRFFYSDIHFSNLVTLGNARSIYCACTNTMWLVRSDRVCVKQSEYSKTYASGLIMDVYWFHCSSVYVICDNFVCTLMPHGSGKSMNLWTFVTNWHAVMRRPKERVGVAVCNHIMWLITRCT